MLAVGKGFIDIVTMLHVCPLIDINHQDNDGNTALMIAAQAGTSRDPITSTSALDSSTFSHDGVFFFHRFCHYFKLHP